jgi:formylglycine-generating enzyme required for sulfatase activity
MPLFWALKDGQYTLRTMSKVMALPVDWPAEVNNLEATAFCNWKGKKVGKNYRLPT